MMKILTSILVLLALFLPLAGAEEIPNLVGNWTSVSTGAIYEIRDIIPGHQENLTYMPDVNFTMAIVDQNGRRFLGKKLPDPNPEEEETVLGVIGSDNKTLYMVDENGYLDGKLVSANEIEFAYRQVGPDGMIVALGKFTRA